jgi:hypothetical protein
MAKVHERFLVLIRLKRRSGLPVILRGHPAEMGYRHIHVPLERSGHRGGLPEDGPEEGGHGKERKVDQWINAGMCAGDRTSLMSPTTEAYSSTAFHRFPRHGCLEIARELSRITHGYAVLCLHQRRRHFLYVEAGGPPW